MTKTRTAAKPLPQMTAARYKPEPGHTITVELPDERTRGTIEKVISDTAVIVSLQHFTTSKSHNYRKGDLVPCKFEALGLGVPGWRAVSERELQDSADRQQKKRKKG